MSAVAFLLSPVGRWLAGAGAVLGACLALWLYVGHVNHEAAVARALAASEAVEIAGLKLQAKQAGATARIDVASASAQAAIHATTNNNLQKVPLYVPRKADAQCIVGNGAVQLLDAAAKGVTVPAAPSGVPDADSGVALSELVSDDIANAGAYHTLAERLKAWDEWYDAQAAIVR